MAGCEVPGCTGAVTYTTIGHGGPRQLGLCDSHVRKGVVTASMYSSPWMCACPDCDTRRRGSSAKWGVVAVPISKHLLRQPVGVPLSPRVVFTGMPKLNMPSRALNPPTVSCPCGKFIGSRCRHENCGYAIWITPPIGPTHAKDAHTRMLVLCPGFGAQLDLKPDGRIVPTMLYTSLLSDGAMCSMVFTTLKGATYILCLSNMQPTSVLYGSVQSLSMLEFDKVHGVNVLPTPNTAEVRNLVGSLSGCAATVVPYCQLSSVIDLQKLGARAKTLRTAGYAILPLSSPHVLVKDVYCAWNKQTNAVACLLCDRCYDSPQHYRDSACFPHGYNDLFTKGASGI